LDVYLAPAQRGVGERPVMTSDISVCRGVQDCPKNWKL
jgi:hypothetical protein